MRTLFTLVAATAISLCGTACLAEESNKAPNAPQPVQNQEEKGKAPVPPAQTPSSPQPTQPNTPAK